MTKTEQQLQAENDNLRSQIEAQKQRELESLRLQLSNALIERDHYKAEAERNAAIGRKIHHEMNLEIVRLRDQIASNKDVPKREVGRVRRPKS